MKRSYDFPADTSVLERIGEIAAEIGEKAGFNEAEIADIQLALDEACTNTIIHGLKCDPSHTFQLVIEWKQGEIDLVVYETGIPYNPVLIEDPDITAPLEKRPVGGLGIYFLRTLMDEANYQIGPDGLKIWRMKKRKAKSVNES